MNPHTDCWLCGGPLEIVVDRMGRTIPRCDPCLREIAKLQRGTPHPDRQCDVCGKERESRKKPLCDHCYRENRLRSQRECQKRLRLKRLGFPAEPLCCGCKRPLELYRRKWCVECGEKEQRRVSHRQYVLRRAAARRERKPKVCQGCSVPIEWPRWKWCVLCGEDANRKAHQRYHRKVKRQLLRAQRREGVTV